MSWMNTFDAKWLRRWSLRLGIAAVVVLAFPVLTVIALISIVGIPLGIAAMAMPTLFVVVALANVIQRLHGRDGPLAVAASVALALGAMAVVANYCNARLDHRADEFLAGDLDTLEKPLRARSIGLVNLDSFRWSKGQTRCDELCQRLLLSGAAERVLVAERKPGDINWTPQTPASAFRLEERESCPPVQLTNHRSDQPVDDASPDEAMRLTIASGRCLVEDATTLADADAVITTGRVHRGVNEVGAGLSLFADTMTVDRASVHLRDKGSFVEGYRWTGVRMLRHLVIPIPTLVGGVELNMSPGFLREEDKRNSREFAQRDLDAVRFVRDELGVDVAVPAAATASSRTALIASGLDSTGPLQPVLRQLIEDFFASLRDVKSLDEATRLLALRALADPRVPAPRETWALVRACANAGEAVNAELAAVLFRRLMTTDPNQREDHPTYLGYPASYLANSIRMLPPGSVLAHRRELEELARDPARRKRASRALEQLTAFGADAVPTLLFLVDAGCALKGAAAASTNRRDGEDWQDVYRSGLAGLCRLGSEASSAREALLARLGDGTLPTGSSSGDLLLMTLVRLGADPEQLRSKFAEDDSADARADFDRRVEKARSDRGCAL